MNYLVLSSYDSMYNSDALVIGNSQPSYYHLSKDEIDRLKDDCGCWFDMKKVKDYLMKHDLIPCNVIDATDGSIDMTFVGRY